MAKMFENKQIIHIAAEIIVIGGLTFYFNQKHKKVVKQVEELNQRLEQQNMILQKHEQIIQRLVNTFNLSIKQNSQKPNVQKPEKPLQKSVYSEKQNLNTEQTLNPLKMNLMFFNNEEKNSMSIEELIEENSLKSSSSSVCDTDVDLDAELENELRELE